MRKNLMAGATVALAALLLSACAADDGAGDASGGSDDGGVTTLEYWAWGTAQKPLVDEWNRTHPDIQVKHTDAGGGSDSSAKLVTAARADSAPDVALVEYNTLPAMIVAGVASDITEYVSDVEGDFAPGVWSQSTFDGASYGVPQDAGPQALTYNKARFDELGIEVPTTWAEFADAAEAVHEADPDAYITTFAPAEFGGFAAFAQQAGAEWWTVDGGDWTVGFDDPASVEVADYWQDLIDRDLVLAEPLLTPEWNASLNDGNILSWPAGLWAAGVINGVAGDMAGDWAMAPLPQWTEGDPAVAFQGGSAMVVTSSSKNAEAAAEFAAWMGTAEESASIQIKEGQYPASLLGQELTLESDPPALMPQQDDYWEIAAEIAGTTIPDLSWGPNVNVASSAFQDAMSAAVTDGTPLRDALTATEDVVFDDMETSGFTVTRK
ncbi:ABC transporter substrate-binding protein [Promicromonospora sp. NPDC090134]|uniref:ABC transporter substrate-binding protein n=1 Tax=Promicromonospora sp. NPDC090134 TaxID=3364408 RepID=UPI00381DFA3E